MYMNKVLDLEEYKENPVCPKCKDDSIFNTNTFYSDESIEEVFECLTCGFKWVEVYTLIEIKPYEP